MVRPEPIAAVIFDCDGTLVFTMHPRQSVAQEMAESVVFIQSLSALTPHFRGLLGPGAG